MADIAQAHAGHDDGHAHRSPYLDHHFESMSHQNDSGKLGMWLFLATEVLLFGGLFAAYAVYRARRPEIFEWSHILLNWRLGLLNTVILLFSSLTMALAVRAAQLNQRRALPIYLGITLACGFGFMIVKGIEYTEKFEHGIKPGVQNFSLAGASEYRTYVLKKSDPHGAGHTSDGHGETASEAAHGAKPAAEEGAHAAAEPAAPAAVATPPRPRADTTLQSGVITPLPGGSEMVQAGYRPEPLGYGEPRNVWIYFSIYYVMTGLHGLHVLIGMGVLGWLMYRSIKGVYSSEYYSPVDIGGLYWHLVDLIWIFLFPLLYLVE